MLALLLLTVPVDFDTQVMPVLTRAGCNTGACHGAASGQGGFKLSLWGSDPAADHDAIVRQFEGRRINLARPERSLFLRKPTLQTSHRGGRKLAPESAGARILLQWIRQGAPRKPSRALVRLHVEPAEVVLANPGEFFDLRVTAEFDTGKVDVTPWAVFTPEDSAAVAIEAGRGKVQRRGLHTIVVRFLDQLVAVRVVVPVGTQAIDLARTPRNNYIDDEVLALLQRLRLAPAPPADDALFLRRLRLDLTGTLPSADEVREFLADTRADKRQRLIERLLASREFVDYWTLKWATLLGINSRSLGKEGATVLHGWLREQIARCTPLDQLARELLTGTGDAFRVGPANFARLSGDARAQAENVSRVFMGVRLQCANCHDHPLDRWTQDDYHGLAAVFARLERGRVVRLATLGEVIHPRSGQPARPRLPGCRTLDPERDQRQTLARWLTDESNSWFARATVNRIWRELLGRGLIHPVDDVRATNPATHPRLLDRLTADLVAARYDLRHIIRRIVNSETYQRGPRRTGPADDRFYSHALTRPLEAEVLADAIVAVTAVPDRHGDLPLGTRAITLADSLIPSRALEVLGRCSRLGPCEDEMASQGLARTLHLINGGLLNDKIRAPQGRLRQMLTRTDAAIIEEFHLRALGRLPTHTEAVHWKKALAGLKGEERAEALEDFLWALLTSKEFTTNH